VSPLLSLAQNPRSSPHYRPVASAPGLSYHVPERTHAPMGQFGNKFRKAREAKNLSYDDVSNVTKIGSRMLQAIEDERFDELPGGVFNRGFIRAYAKHLGLDSEEAVTGYLACLRQAQIDAADQTHAVRQPAAPPKPPAQKAPQPYIKPELKKQAQVEVDEVELPELQLPKAEHVRKPPREFLVPERKFPWNIAAALILVLVLVAFLWVRHSRKHTETASATPVTMTPAPSSPTPTLAAVTTPAKTPATNRTATPPQPKPTPPATQPPADHSAKDVTSTATPLKTPDAPKPAPPTKPAAKMTLIIRASETSWISVTADGQLVSQETLIAPANVTIRATQQITAHIGNAAGVTFVWNGQEFPIQGAESEVKILTFDQSGMHVLPTPSQ